MIWPFNKIKQLHNTENNYTNEFSFLEIVKPDIIAEFIMNEHPQTIAVILSHLKSDLAAGILKNIPEDLSSEIIIRISRIQDISPLVITKVATNLENRLKIALELKTEIGGINTAQKIVKLLRIDNDITILKKIAQVDLAKKTSHKPSPFRAESSGGQF